jgi:4-methyl-5(b-hydroxyethyl)-thiazole monophosphate biosynthesis
MKIMIPLAEGFEETEAITIIDLLRRAQIEAVTFSLTTEKLVKGSHGIYIQTDFTVEAIQKENFSGIVLPGGMPGSNHLRDSDVIMYLLDYFNSEKLLVAAICAAPIALGKAGILKGVSACCYPGCENQLTDAIISDNPICVDGNIITAKGMAFAIPFSLEIIKYIINEETANKIADGILFDLFD